MQQSVNQHMCHRAAQNTSEIGHQIERFVSASSYETLRVFIDHSVDGCHQDNGQNSDTTGMRSPDPCEPEGKSSKGDEMIELV